MANDTDGTVARVVMLLQAFAEGGDELTVTGVAERLELPRSTIHRLLHLLIAGGLVEAIPGRHHYRIGAEYYRISAMVVGKVRIPQLARPLMVEMVNLCKETCLLGLYLPAQGRMVFAGKVDSRYPIRYAIEMHKPLSLAWGASGWAIMAFLKPAEIDSILETAGPSPGCGGVLPPKSEIHGELARIRSRGYAITRGQKIAGAVGFAAPIFGADGRVLGDLCLTVPEVRYCSEMESQLGGNLVYHASQLSAMLGHNPEQTRGRARTSGSVG